MVCGRCRHRLYGGIYYGDLPYCIFPEPEHHPGGGGFHSGEEPDDGTGSGENTSFADGRSISTWSRGMVSAAAENNLISGYPDGTFRPQKSITRGGCGDPPERRWHPGQQAWYYYTGRCLGQRDDHILRCYSERYRCGGKSVRHCGVELGDVVLENVKVLGRSWSAAAASVKRARTA